MKKDALMLDQLRCLFDAELVDECLDTADYDMFCIIEDEALHKLIITTSALIDGFSVINPHRKSLFVISIDHCFLEQVNEYQGERCDCVVFDDTHFCFVELKLNVLKPRQAAQKLRLARKQLGNVIRFFQEIFARNAKDFLGLELEAYVAMRQNIYPRSRASRMVVFVEFFDEYGVKLIESNFKKF